MARAAILTVGNDLSGDVENTNGSWLARRLAGLGVEVTLIAVVADEINRVAVFVREQATAVDVVIVTGGLGGTPDDVTRESIAAAFGVGQVEHRRRGRPRLRARFTGDPEYAARWALLPEGSRPLEIPNGGAPGFVIENVYVLPGLPAEMEAMFETIADEVRGGAPIVTWRLDLSDDREPRSSTCSRRCTAAPPGRARRFVPELLRWRCRGRGRDQVR